MDIFDIFKTDKTLDEKGIDLEYGNTRIRVLRAGPSNKKYVAKVSKEFNKVRKLEEAGALSNEQSSSIMRKIYAETIIVGWKTQVDGVFVDGISTGTGSSLLLEFNTENVIATLNILPPEFFADLIQQAAKLENFRTEELEIEVKN